MVFYLAHIRQENFCDYDYKDEYFIKPFTSFVEQSLSRTRQGLKIAEKLYHGCKYMHVYKLVSPGFT